MTADCLSREKRGGTLGLLFLTDLRGYDVVAGKLVSRTASSACCLLAALPTLGIALFLRGVTGSDYFRMILALLNGLFFSAALGMFVSALCRHERSALSATALGVLGLSVALPAIGWASAFTRLLSSSTRRSWWLHRPAPFGTSSVQRLGTQGRATRLGVPYSSPTGWPGLS